MKDKLNNFILLFSNFILKIISLRSDNNCNKNINYSVAVMQKINMYVSEQNNKLKNELKELKFSISELNKTKEKINELDNFNKIINGYNIDKIQLNKSNSNIPNNNIDLLNNNSLLNNNTLLNNNSLLNNSNNMNKLNMNNNLNNNNPNMNNGETLNKNINLNDDINNVEISNKNLLLRQFK
jgi:hypothetical protein